MQIIRLIKNKIIIATTTSTLSDANDLMLIPKGLLEIFDLRATRLVAGKLFLLMELLEANFKTTLRNLPLILEFI